MPIKKRPPRRKRPVKLTKEQLEEIIRRHLVNGESVNSISKDYNVDESTIRNYLKKTVTCKSNPNGSEKTPERKAEAIQNTAVEIIEYARKRLGSESDARIAVSLAEQTISVKGQYTQLANETLEVALQFSRWAKKNTHKVFQGDTLDVNSLKQSLIVADAINKYASAGNRVYEMNKPKEAEAEDNQITFIGGLPELPK
jgi:transposase